MTNADVESIRSTKTAQRNYTVGPRAVASSYIDLQSGYAPRSSSNWGARG